MRNGTKLRKITRHGASLLFSLVLALAGVIPTAVCAADGSGSFKGDSVINESVSYEMCNNGDNNKAVCGRRANAAFTYEADITYAEADLASLIFGAGENDPALIGREGNTTAGFFGLELSRTGKVDGADLNLKLFYGGPAGTSLDGIIPAGTGGASGVDLTRIGTYEITGSVDGTDIPAIIRVAVKGEAESPATGTVFSVYLPH